MSDNRFRLITLGRLALVDAAGEPASPLAKHPRKLALLCVLALARRPVTRDALVEMFWGEQDERRARHSLSDALSEIRQVLGASALNARGAAIALASDAPLEVDALQFRSACGVGDWARAVALYEGPFLEGVFVKDARSFESWTSGEHANLEQLFLKACDTHVAALTAAGEQEAIADVAARWLGAHPLDPAPAIALLTALRAPNTPTAERAALAAYDQLAARLIREYDAQPDPAVIEIAAEVRARLASIPDGAAAFPLVAGAAPDAGRMEGAPRRAFWVAGAAVALAAAALGVALSRRAPAVAQPTRPVVAVIGVRDLRGDTTLTWIADGITQMIAADLARSSALEIVAPERVRQVADAVAGQASDSGGLGSSNPLAVAHALGASWAVTGGLTRANGTYILDVELYDVEHRRSLNLYTITDSALPVLADRAAARVLAAANDNEPGPHFADIETASLEAYEHFVRSAEASDEGRMADQRAELDRAIALDSGFVTALAARMWIAQQNGEEDVLRRLTVAFRRAGARATPWDRLVLDTYTALHNAEAERSEALARELVTRYPHDPRSYETLSGILQDHGKWEASDSVLRRELALDSLAVTPARGPCAPCTAYRGLSLNAFEEGDLDAAERYGRRWVDIQPNAPAAWAALSSTLEAEGRFDAALVAARRARVLAPLDPVYADRVVRVLLVARRYADADTAIAALLRTGSEAGENAYDLLALLQRERGELRASARTIEDGVRRYPGLAILRLEEANSLARLGDFAAVRRLDEPQGHEPEDSVTFAGTITPVSGLIGGRARRFCWVHALEAEDLAGTRDTLLLATLADSIQNEATRSYYGRDERLASHVRGLIAEIGGRPAEAARDFQAARWGHDGWTATLVHLARAQLALSRPADAIATLRDAYTAPLDAMGRYVPRSELDFWMWKAFDGAGMRDSAAVYEGYVRRAWRKADPEVRRLLPPRAAGRNREH